MKPIWIVDDDPSIRFVLEKALGREGWATRSFIQARDVLTALSDVDAGDPARQPPQRSEEHTSELQSPCNLVCRLLLEKKKFRSVVKSYYIFCMHSSKS